jgi:hypothetical protein
METKITIELTEEERQLLTFALGIATARAPKERRTDLVRLVNLVNRDTPGWRPYEVP